MKNKEINIYGFAVDVDYRISDGQVEVLKAHIKDGTNAVAIQSLDIISEAKEILEAELLEVEDLFNEMELDKEMPF